MIPEDTHDIEIENASVIPLTDMQLLLTDYKVKGFALQDKTWCRIS
jgi:hypothetical protein